MARPVYPDAHRLLYTSRFDRRLLRCSLDLLVLESILVEERTCFVVVDALATADERQEEFLAVIRRCSIVNEEGCLHLDNIP